MAASSIVERHPCISHAPIFRFFIILLCVAFSVFTSLVESGSLPIGILIE